MENYTQHITRTRIAIPRKRADLISRQRLLDALDELLDKKVIIIAAPAGYGKTSLLIDLADDLALPVCWYSLDALDQNISRFLEYFVASIQVKFPDFKTNIINVLHSSYQKEVDVDAMVTMLVNDIYDQITEHFVIMLDDYHLVVEDTQINQFLSRFLQNVEENCHIVFASRTLLALPDLPLMVARGLVGGLGFEELAFTTGETRELFFNNHHIVLSDTEAENLCKQTEGWITGLLLTAQTSITRLQAHEKSLRATGVNINDYFELIYNAQPQHIQQFLLYTSLLEDFDFDTVNQTVAKLFPELGKQYKACADHIFKANLFVQSVGLDGLSLRYHHLFLDYLQQKVRLEQAETYEKLQDIIATHYRETQQWEKAYEIYRKEGQLEKQIALLEEAGVAMMFAGQIGTLKNWMKHLPEKQIFNNASLSSLMGNILGTHGDQENSLIYLNQALKVAETDQQNEIIARTLVRKSMTLRSLGQYYDSINVAKRSIDLSSVDLTLREVRAEAYRMIGTCYMEIGDSKLCLQSLEYALQDFKFLNKENEIAITNLNISTAYQMMNQFDIAETKINEVIHYWEQTNNTIWLANALNNLGFIQHSMGKIEEAIMSLEKGLHYCKISNYSRMESVTLSSIGDVYSDLGILKEANNLYEQSRNLAKENKITNIEIYAINSLVNNSIYQKNYVQANKYLHESKTIVDYIESKYHKYVTQFTEGVLLVHNKKFIEATKLFEDNLKFFEEINDKTFVAKNLIYMIIAYFKLEKHQVLKPMINEFEDYLLLQYQFVLIALGQKEFKYILDVNKKYPEFTIFSEWIESIKKYELKIPVYRQRIRQKTTILPFAPAGLEIYALGELKVKFNNNWLSSSDWQTQSARDLFFLILSNPQGLSKEAIGLLLWPEDSEQELKFHFKNAIYRVRHALSKDSIILDGDRYYFNKNLDYHFDVDEFRNEINAVMKSNNWNEQFQHYINATRLYKGKYLAGIEAEWIQQERNELHQYYINMLTIMSNKAFEQEDFTRANEIAQISLEYDPCNEEAYRIAMRAQAAKGNRMEVERLFQLCKKNLSDELDTPPSQKTQKLHKTLMTI